MFYHPLRPLHVAARNGLTVVVQELLAKGASVLAVDENGKYVIISLFYYLPSRFRAMRIATNICILMDTAGSQISLS